ncbi:MAG: ubiquinone/menaquinone biosynthesis methyltransferase [Syntrophales bacterium]
MKRKYPSVSKATEAERIVMVKNIFGTVTGKYDFLNHFLSLRRDVAWRRFTVRRMRFFKTNHFLDVACGTGDLAIEAVSVYPHIHVAGLDFVGEMIELACLKIKKGQLSKNVSLIKGDALTLPFVSSSFDVVGTAFGIRNIPDRMQALREMTRVVVPGGQVMVLEMVSPHHTLLRGIYRIYLSKILPRLARLLSSNPAAYHYLADSIINFPPPDVFCGVMEEACLTEVKAYPLSLGITYLFIGIKPK